jgi:hypothetical protein
MKIFGGTNLLLLYFRAALLLESIILQNTLSLLELYLCDTINFFASFVCATFSPLFHLLIIVQHLIFQLTLLQSLVDNYLLLFMLRVVLDLLCLRIEYFALLGFGEPIVQLVEWSFIGRFILEVLLLDKIDDIHMDAFPLSS